MPASAPIFVDGLHPTRLSSLMEVAIRPLRTAPGIAPGTDQARTRWPTSAISKKQGTADENDCGLDESAAMALLRRMAMDRKQRIGGLRARADHAGGRAVMTMNWRRLAAPGTVCRWRTPRPSSSPRRAASSPACLDVELRVGRAWGCATRQGGDGRAGCGADAGADADRGTLGLDGTRYRWSGAVGSISTATPSTVSKALHERHARAGAGPARRAQWAKALAKLLEADPQAHLPQPVFAHVFPFFTHLRAAHVAGQRRHRPGSDVRLCVVPPPRMVGELAAGRVDGFLRRRPWSEVATLRGLGTNGGDQVFDLEQQPG